jgi:hypothetical protein
LGKLGKLFLHGTFLYKKDNNFECTFCEYFSGIIQALNSFRDDYLIAAF